MDSQFRVKRVLCHAQYGDISLCEISLGAMATFNLLPPVASAASPPSPPPSPVNAEGASARTLAVIKQISWSRVHAKQQHHSATNDAMQPSDDPMVEIDVAAKVCAAGGHKNIVQYHTVLRSGSGSFGIVMEYCDQGDLLKRLDCLPDNRLPQAEALLALQQITEGLRFLHEEVGVAHRDVSLENVMVHDGVCKLGDFGLSARIFEDDEDAIVPRRRRFVDGRVGKLGYMAPEVAAGEMYDPSLADIWSLGVLFFVLLTGSPLVEMAAVECPAFRAFSRLGLRRVLDDWKMSEMFHEETMDLCDRMLQVDPRNRITPAQILHHPAFDRLAPALP